MAVAEPSEELDDFQQAFGTQCRLAAQALAEGSSRDAVRVASQGTGDSIALCALRNQRAVVNTMAQRARRKMLALGIEVDIANSILIKRMRMSRGAVETEWGVTEKTQAGPGSVDGERWVRLSLPIVNVTETA